MDLECVRLICLISFSYLVDVKLINAQRVKLSWIALLFSYNANHSLPTFILFLLSFLNQQI